MAVSIYSFVPEAHIKEVLENLQAFTGLAIQLIDSSGQLLMSFGQSTAYCSILKSQVFDRSTCFQLHKNAGRHAQMLGEAYIFACHANLNHIAFPLIREQELLGSVIIGPFLMDKPDSTLISDLAEKQNLSPGLALELFDELANVAVLPPAKVNQLKKLVDHLLSPLLPGERMLLLQNQQKMTQQARINETIQMYKKENASQAPAVFYGMEKELLDTLHTCTMAEATALLNKTLAHVLYSEGGQLEAVRIRAMELMILLSRAVMEGGAKPDTIYHLSGKFLQRLQEEQELEALCLTMQEVLESFLRSMFWEKDKGNLYIRKALRYMADHYSSHLELQQVAEYVGLSPSYFSTLFRQTVGVPFREHLNHIRVEESKRLLLTGQYTLADIAVSMGFPDQSYYCKVFRKITGVTPGKYRR